MKVRSQKWRVVVVAALVGSISQIAMPRSTPRTTGFFIGDRGNLRPAAPEGADFTMAADGITIITIAWQDCFNFFGPGDFRLDILSGPINEDGGVSISPDGTRLDVVTIPATFVDDCWYAEGFYRVPDEFNRGSDELLSIRGVSIEARFIPQAGAPAIATVFVDLVRPPLVFVHGLWSNPETWEFSLTADTVFPIKEFADYRASAASYFSNNKTVVFLAIQKALQRCVDAQIRCTRVDVVGHSMGGLLGRIHSNSAQYATPLNRYHGNVRKLITLDTPHSGSLLADFLSILAADLTSQGIFMRALFQRVGKPIDQGAIFDLSTGSVPITTLGASPVPAHALVGVGGPDLLGTASRPMGAFYRALFLASVVSGTDVFGPAQHDLVVSRPSQEGGLAASATTEFGFPDGIHFGIPFVTLGNTGSDLYGDRARELLDTPTSETVWGLLPAGSFVGVAQRVRDGADPQQSCSEGTVSPQNARAGDFALTITSPAPGTVVTPGATITVSVAVSPSETVDQIVVAGRDEAINDTTAPFEISFPVPLEAFRTYTIEAFGRNNTTNEYFSSAPLDLIAEPSAALQALRINPAEAFIVGPGDSLQLSVTGQFADGVYREVPPSEVVWTALNPTIVSVSADGLATGVAVGQATVRADSQTLTTTRVVEVLPPAPLIFVDNFESGDTSEWSASAP